jgi:CRP-like cAMP-binding protein
MLFATNRLLDSLAHAERQALAGLLHPIELKQHSILFEVREAVTKSYFPIDAVISLVVPLSTGEVVEAAMVGRDGVIGAAASLDGRVSLNRAVVQIAGKSLVCDSEALKALLAGHARIGARMGAHEQVLMAQAQQSAACNVTHHIESRLARWLLRAADLHGGDELELTQEYVAEMLGVRRTSVSVVANTLQQAGMIRYARGHIKILNADALRETACECYEAVRLNYEALLHPSND